MRPAHVVGRTACRLRRRISVASDGGMVTAELAMALPALVLVVVALSAVVSGVLAVAKASDAARSAARSASVGVTHDDVVVAAARLAPSGSTVTIDEAAGWVTVTVAPPEVQLGPVSLPLPDVSGSAPLERQLFGTGR